ncbi:MAG: WcaF family extracellular polysaccharide biosynthesis acetyltransferase [Lysobacterales bacterium]
MHLERFDNGGFHRGRSWIVEALWQLVGALVASWIPGSNWRRAALRLFGAHIGEGVVIKPRFRVKFPWRLKVGDHSWLGESVWIDNLAPVHIGISCCLSQGVYLCTGSHDWNKDRFDLITAPIDLQDRVWLAAFSRVGPGRQLGQGAVLQLAAVLTEDALPWTRYAGNPATACGTREVSETASPRPSGQREGSST